MIEYDNTLEEMTLTCDFCEEIDFFSGGWGDSWANAKKMGWRTFKNEYKWVHKCKCCNQAKKAGKVFK